MSVRAKFKVQANHEEGDTATITLLPVYSGSEENKEFFRYTPGGLITLNVVNQAAAVQFKVGKEFYVDFTPADG